MTFPAYAVDPMDAINAEIFDKGTANIKAEFRKCSGDGDCTTVMSICRWRPVNKLSQKHVSEVSSGVKPECKWPPPPKTPPVARCVDNICSVLPDGKYY